MAIISKPKKASLGISITVLILGLAVAALYFLSLYSAANSGFDFNGLISFVKDTVMTYDFKSLKTIAVILFYAGPLVFSIIGLFGKGFRTPNLLVLISFTYSLVYRPFSVLASNQPAKTLFDFSSASSAYLASAFIVLILGFILTFINAEKSK